MLSLFRAFTDRLKAVFVTNLAREVEAELLTSDAERQAHLHRLAARYDQEGLAAVAKRLRQRADSLDCQQPLALVLPSVDHLLDRQVERVPVLLPSPTKVLPKTPRLALASPAAKKKGR